MSATYRAVQWNRQKRRYDLALWAGILVFLLAFVGTGAALFPDATAETLLIRGLGLSALLLLHLVLSVGPLARLDPRFLPLLYNRRHMGVSLFALGAAHGGFSLVQYHALGDLNPLLSLLVANPRWDSVPHFPFQQLGAGALFILFLMAATSHDFWLNTLGAPAWKRLHMGVYLAWALLVMHVALGVLQAETSPLYALALGAGVAWVLGLHLWAARREAPGDVDAPEGWVDVCAPDEIPEGRAKVVCANGERVAVFRYQRRISAVSNACKHQNGPLGEGRVLDGCITCPWHGYQYRPETGASPPPFTEAVATYAVKVEAGRVWLDPRPRPPGTFVEPALVPEAG